MAENSEELIRPPHLEWTEAFQKLIKDTHLKHLTVGWVGPTRITEQLKEAGCLPTAAETPGLKISDICWNAMTDRIFVNDFTEWEAKDLKGKEICDCLTNRGIHINKASICHSSILGAGIIDTAWKMAIAKLSRQTPDIKEMRLERNTFYKIPIEWPTPRETTTDFSKWNEISVAYIFETYATCTLLLNAESATNTLRSISWAIIMADPRSRKAMAKHCKRKLIEVDTSPTLSEEGESKHTDVDDDANTTTEEREEEGSGATNQKPLNGNKLGRTTRPLDELPSKGKAESPTEGKG